MDGLVAAISSAAPYGRSFPARLWTHFVGRLAPESRACLRGARRTGFGALVALVVSVAGASAAQAEGFSVQENLHIDVRVGPQHDHLCNVIADLYRPKDATVKHPDPAILMTNGYEGSKSQFVEAGEEFASEGYVVLVYSGLGFGGSGCPIELDQPDWDGAAASQLVTFLGGGSAATNGTRVDYVIHDKVAHNGVHYPHDPRVGMFGGSYAGEVQFAAAEQDPRIDTIVPVITWNNLAFSLAPNNASLPNADSVTSAVPGVAKTDWLALLVAGAAISGSEYPITDPDRLLSDCPGSNTASCTMIAQLLATGYPDQTSLALLHYASVHSYMKNIRVPVMLMQGEDDTFFTLHEAVANYAALRAQGTPVKMVWQSWGHSDMTPAPDEDGAGMSLLDSSHQLTVEGRMVLEWFNHYLKHDRLTPRLDFSFYRPWIKGSAFNAYASAPRYPIGTRSSMYLSGDGSLASSRHAVRSGSASFVTPEAGAPTSVTEISDISQSVPLFDPPGTYAKFESAPLRHTADVIGIPTVRLRISAPIASLSGDLGTVGNLALFFKLEDIAPNGTVTLPDRLIAPARFDHTGAVEVSLPGIVHRFPAGDRIALIVAGSDAAYRGSNVATPVTISTDPADPGTLALPVATSRSYSSVKFAFMPKRKRCTRTRTRRVRSGVRRSTDADPLSRAYCSTGDPLPDVGRTHSR